MLFSCFADFPPSRNIEKAAQTSARVERKQNKIAHTPPRLLARVARSDLRSACDPISIQGTCPNVGMRDREAKGDRRDDPAGPIAKSLGDEKREIYWQMPFVKLGPVSTCCLQS